MYKSMKFSVYTLLYYGAVVNVVRPSVVRQISFPHFFSSCLQILIWYLVY